MRICLACRQDSDEIHPRSERCPACIRVGRCRDCRRAPPEVEIVPLSARCRNCASTYLHLWRKDNPTYARVYYLDWKVRRVVWRLWDGCRRRSIKHAVPFTLAESDLTIPTHCPVLGIPLAVGTLQDKDASPTVDRMVPALGYVPGNVAVISHRANRIKSDATPEELGKILEWIQAST